MAMGYMGLGVKMHREFWGLALANSNVTIMESVLIQKQFLLTTINICVAWNRRKDKLREQKGAKSRQKAKLTLALQLSSVRRSGVTADGLQLQPLDDLGRERKFTPSIEESLLTTVGPCTTHVTLRCSWSS